MASILTFPRSLRLDADNGKPHIGFSLTGEHKPDPTEIDRIHLFIPSNFAVKDGASYTGVDLGALTAANTVKSNLNKYKNEKINKKIFIEVNSIYKKNILTKDGSGKITSYELEAVVIFLIQPLNKKIQIIEKKIMNSMDDKFEEARYERTIKQNFASSISNKLSSELIID